MRGKEKTGIKRILAIFVCVFMLFGSIPSFAFAEEQSSVIYTDEMNTNLQNNQSVLSVFDEDEVSKEALESVFRNLGWAATWQDEFSEDEVATPGMIFSWLCLSDYLDEYFAGAPLPVSKYMDLCSREFLNYDREAVFNHLKKRGDYNEETDEIQLYGTGSGGDIAWVLLDSEKEGDTYTLTGLYCVDLANSDNVTSDKKEFYDYFLVPHNNENGDTEMLKARIQDSIQFTLKNTSDGYKIASYQKLSYYDYDGIRYSYFEDDGRYYPNGIVSNGSCGTNLSWVLNTEGVLKVSGTGDIVDSEYGDSIYGPFSKVVYHFSSLVIEEGVISIGDDNFNFSNCINVEFPESLISIGEGAFRECTDLTKVVLPDSVQYIGEGAFMRCSSLFEVKLPKNLTTIERYTFLDCTNLKHIEIPMGVQTIEASAFEGCSGLKVIEIPESVTEIDDTAFYECNQLLIKGIPGSEAHVYAEKFDIEFECTNHIWNDIYTTEKQATCSDMGVKALYCSVCNKRGDEKTIPVTDHNLTSWEIVQEATCQNDGEKIRVCTNCNFKETKCVTKLEHTLEWISAVDATCKKTGTTLGVYCSSCKKVLLAPISTPIIEHNWNDGEVTKAPTTTESGIKTFTCKSCKDTYTEEITKLVEPEGEAPQEGQEVPSEPIDPTDPEGPDSPTRPDSPVKPIDETVYRIYGSDRYATAFKSADALKEKLQVSKFDTIIVASGKTFADALPGSYLAAKKDAPILLINAKKSSEVKAYINENLISGGTVYVLGGEAAVASSWLNGITFKRLGGANRYETNLNILKEAGVDNNTKIMVCTGKNFADSLSVSATGAPILMVNKTLSSAQKEFLNSINGEKYCIIGGTAAVSSWVEKECKELGPTARYAGDNRYTTSLEVAEAFFDEPDYAVLAYAQNFPDGLSAGPLAYNLNAPLILTKTGKENVAANYTKAEGIKAGFVLGGSGLISDTSVKTIFQMDNNTSIIIK